MTTRATRSRSPFAMRAAADSRARRLPRGARFSSRDRAPERGGPACRTRLCRGRRRRRRIPGRGGDADEAVAAPARRAGRAPHPHAGAGGPARPLRFRDRRRARAVRALDPGRRRGSEGGAQHPECREPRGAQARHHERGCDSNPAGERRRPEDGGQSDHRAQAPAGRGRGARGRAARHRDGGRWGGAEGRRGGASQPGLFHPGGAFGHRVGGLEVVADHAGGARGGVEVPGTQVTTDRVLDAGADDDQYDLTLRPRLLSEYVGQQQVRENLGILLEAARRRGDPVEHVLLCGPPGLGKTTLAHIIANELGVAIKVSSGPAIDHQGALGSILLNLSTRDVFFIDEIHRLNSVVEESLYPALEDFRFDAVLGKGVGASAATLPLPHFTCIGATTRQGLLSAPLRDRFGAVYRLDFYNKEELESIVRRSARILDIDIHAEAVSEIARRARGTPRIANRLLRRVRDYAQVRADGRATVEATKQALAMLDIDELGLEPLDRRLLETLIKKFKGGPVGLDTIATSISEEPETVEDVHEPYLIQIGFLARTSRGRVATELAYRHLGIAPPEPGPQQGRLL